MRSCRGPAQCLSADARREIAAVRRSFRGKAGNRSQQHSPNIQALFHTESSERRPGAGLG